jgi:hypothetical protein
MAGIPLPALDIKQQQSDPLESYGRLVQLQSLLQQQKYNQQAQPLKIQEAQQQLQSGELENQQKAMQLKDQQTVMQVLSQNQGDLDRSLPQLAGKVSPQTFMGLAKAHLDMRKSVAELNEKELANQKQSNDSLLGLIEQAKQLPPDQYAQQWPNIAQQALQINPKLQGHIDPAQPVPQEALGQYEIGLQTQSVAQAQELKKREVTAQEKTADAHMISAQRLPVDQQELTDFLRKHPGKGPADYAKWKASLSPQAQINVQGGAPNNDLAQAVAEGRMKIGDVLTYRTPLPIRKQFLNSVMAINPSYRSYDYDVEKGVEKAFTSGTEGRNLTAFNTAIEHAKQLDSATNDLKNFDVRAMNKLANAYGVETGKDQVTNFNVIKNALVGEISKVFKGGQATDAEINHITGPFDAANSPAQLKGAIKQAIALMNSKRNALKQQYDMGKQGRPNFGEGEQAQPQAAAAATSFLSMAVRS